MTYTWRVEGGYCASPLDGLLLHPPQELSGFSAPKFFGCEKELQAFFRRFRSDAAVLLIRRSLSLK